MIGIAIAAVGMDPRVVRRCYRSLADAKIEVPYRVHFQTECEPFSRSRARNLAILELVPHCDKIICLDVDCLVPPGLIEFAEQNVRDGQAVWTLVRRIPEFDGRYCWDDWKEIRPWPWGTGAFVAMTTADWLLVGGWDERLTGWGSEDDVLAARRRQLGIETLKVTDRPLVHVDHEYRGRDMKQAKKNRKLGSTPPPRNYLAGRLPIESKSHQLFLWPTARCQHDCPRCSQGALMRRASGYEMSLDEVDAIIDAVRKSGYRPFRKVILAGGETLLWAHLEEGSRRLADAKLGPIELYTNALAVDRAELAAPHVDWLRVSLYQWNGQAVEKLRERHAGKVRVIDSRRHWALPTGPYGTEVLPADCVGPGYLVFDRHVYPCCNLPATALALGHAVEDVPRVRLQPGFIEALLPQRRRLDALCRACIGNRKVQPWLK